MRALVLAVPFLAGCGVLGDSEETWARWTIAVTHAQVATAQIDQEVNRRSQSLTPFSDMRSSQVSYLRRLADNRITWLAGSSAPQGASAMREQMLTLARQYRSAVLASPGSQQALIAAHAAWQREWDGLMGRHEEWLKEQGR